MGESEHFEKGCITSMMTRLSNNPGLCAAATIRKGPGFTLFALGPSATKGPSPIHNQFSGFAGPIPVRRAVDADSLQNRGRTRVFKAPNNDGVERKRQRTILRASVKLDKVVHFPDPGKRPSKVLPWVEQELFDLESTFVKGFWEEGAENARLAKRNLTYPAYAEAVLQSWADQSDRENFVERLCDWAWGVMSDQERPLLRRAAVELFLGEFLGGQEFGLATAINIDGLSGSQIMVPLFNKFVAKTASEEHHKRLNKEQLRRLETFLENLLYSIFTAILNGRKKEAEEAEVRKVKEEILSRAPWNLKQKGSE